VLEQIGGGCIPVEDASLVSLTRRRIRLRAVSWRFVKPMECLAGEKLLSDQALELDAVGTMPGHGFPSFESLA
jgi:hypothetical protein